MKIVYLYSLSQDAYDYIREKLPEEIEIIARIQSTGENQIPPNKDPTIIEETKSADILMGPYVTEEILDQAIPENGGKLKLIFIPWTGVDRLDFNLLRKYNIKVANSHGNARTVAEHAIALLLAAAKNLIHHDRLLRNGDWSSRFNKMSSINITGKTIGLLGYGAIGTQCAKLLQGFEVKIIGCRKNPNKSSEEQKELASKIYSIQELTEFLKECDIIINSLPLTKDTEGILGEIEFQQMKDGIILVNVGRGLTIDEKAFYDAVASNKIFAAGIDPQWKYPPRGASFSAEDSNRYFPSNYPLQNFDQIVLSPHRAADLAEGYERAHWDDVIENILRIYHHQEPMNIIDIEKEY